MTGFSYTGILNKWCPDKKYGKVTDVSGFIIKCKNPGFSVDANVSVVSPTSGTKYTGEVVGLSGDKAMVMLYDDVISGVGNNHYVIESSKSSLVGVGRMLLGRVIDGMGNPIDGKGPVYYENYAPLHRKSINPMLRTKISEPLDVGIKAINGLMTIGKGQRIGIIAGSGVGKSVLLGMITKYSTAGVKVIALVGERGREVREFIENELGDKGMNDTVIVAATSEKSPLERLRAAFSATAIAEYFRDIGEDVVFLMDSSTRFAMARREIGLAIGEPPTGKGYPPSVYALLPKLLERSGNSSSTGSLTGIYTVLAPEDDLEDPIVDAIRSIVDGHIVLDKKLANKNHYPSINILKSKSRVMNSVVSDNVKTLSGKIINLYSSYEDMEELINIGGYTPGNNPKVDLAITKHDMIIEFLQQKTNEKITYSQCISLMENIIQSSPAKK